MNPLSSIIEIGTALIKRVIPDKEEQAKAQLKLIELQQTGQLEEMKTAMSAIIAEAQSNDKWTSRARPSFLYVMYVMILMSIPMGIASLFSPSIVAQMEIGVKGWLVSIPKDLWYLFEIGFTGYCASKAYEKVKTFLK